MALKWYVIRTEPKAEFQAAKALSKDGMRIYLPCVKNRGYGRYGSDRPMFPGYLFINCDRESDDCPSFLPVHKISGWLCFGDVVPDIPDSVISELVREVDTINAENGLWERYPVGGKVKVRSGVFEGIAEVIEEARSPDSKAWVAMHFLGRLVRTQVSWGDMESCSENFSSLQDQSFRGRKLRRTRGNGRRIKTA